MRMDIGAWLKSLGLERYEQAFRDNDIAACVLADLTAEDLSSLGIASVGHRRMLLAAIDALRAARPLSEEVHAVTKPSGAEAERRQLTVLFADLAGSTALASRLDPEDMSELLRAYQSAVAEQIARFEGHVAKLMGDGVLAYFGWPRAHEDEAERAVRAGLAVVEAVARLVEPDGERLACRVGIATGVVVVGDLVGTGAAQEQAVVGETPNLAARLQPLAAPGGIVIAPSTRRLVGSLFELEPLPAQVLKGIPAPVGAFAVIGLAEAQSRFEVRHGSELLPLVGREQELALVLDRWRAAVSGEGQVVLLQGEPGIGKSRIVAALRAASRGDGRTYLPFQASPYHRGSALWPVVRQLERAARFERGDAAEARLEKLEWLFARTVADQVETVSLLAPLLGLEGSARLPALDLPPPLRRQRAIEALIRHVEGLARDQPVLMVVEDLHWLDPTTMELLDLAVDRLQRLPVLLVATLRPELPPPWTAFPHVTLLTLNRLSRIHAADLIETVTRGRTLPGEVSTAILARTEGVPLFVEELTTAVIESGLLRESDGRFELLGPLPALAIPTTLHDSLMARLDRLAPTKLVAQIGAVIGREFPYKLLAVVAGIGESTLKESLAELVGAGLAFQRGNPPEASYTFKHALVQDAAYQSLLRSRRRQLHAAIADALARDFPAVARFEPELLAQHHTQAGQGAQAVEYWSRAGALAISRSANIEAVGHLRHGLECLASLPSGRERDRLELGLRNAIGGPLIAVHGYAAPEVGETFGRARALCERLDETAPLLAALSGEFVFHFVRGDYQMMRATAEQSQRLSEHSPDSALRMASHRLLAITAMHAGRFLEARAGFERILLEYDPALHRPPPVHYVHDPRISALTYLAPILWLLGLPDQARRMSAAAFDYARELDQANLTAHVRVYAGAGLAELLNDTGTVREHADAIVGLADRYGLGYWRLNGLILRGWVLTRNGRGDEGVALMRQSIDNRAALGVGWYQTRYLIMLAEAHLQLGRPDPARLIIGEAKELMARSEGHMWQAEIERIEGELARRGGSVSEALACFEQAIAFAGRQCARSLELRAATSSARLLGELGRRAEGRGVLAPVYGRFTEGFDTPDLLSARALLDQLG
jgi:class 3 adenylate cyclase/predicted ATPase